MGKQVQDKPLRKSASSSNPGERGGRYLACRVQAHEIVRFCKLLGCKIWIFEVVQEFYRSLSLSLCLVSSPERVATGPHQRSKSTIKRLRMYKSGGKVVR